MSDAAPIDPLMPLRHALSVAEGRPDAAALAWLQGAFGRWLAGSDTSESLERSLGLSGGRGAVPVRLALARARRDAAIIDALQLVGADSDWSRWRRAVALAEAINRFESRGTLRRLREAPERAIALEPLAAALWRAFQSGAVVPRTAAGLVRIANAEPASPLA